MYKLTKDNTSVIRKSDGAFIPMDDGNQDYQEYLRWLVGGGVAESYTEHIPYSITQRQMRLTLLEQGMYDQVEGIIDAILGDEGKAAKISWTWAQEIKRDNPLLLQLAAVLGLSDEAVDSLFLSASNK